MEFSGIGARPRCLTVRHSSDTNNFASTSYYNSARNSPRPRLDFGNQNLPQNREPYKKSYSHPQTNQKSQFNNRNPQQFSQNQQGKDWRQNTRNFSQRNSSNAPQQQQQASNFNPNQPANRYYTNNSRGQGNEYVWRSTAIPNANSELADNNIKFFIICMHSAQIIQNLSSHGTVEVRSIDSMLEHDAFLNVSNFFSVYVLRTMKMRLFQFGFINQNKKKSLSFVTYFLGIPC